jgi:hypothetical protein
MTTLLAAEKMHDPSERPPMQQVVEAYLKLVDRIAASPIQIDRDRPASRQD